MKMLGRLRRTQALALAATALAGAVVSVGSAAPAHATGGPSCTTTVHVWANDVRVHSPWDGGRILNQPTIGTVNAGNYCVDSEWIGDEASYGAYHNNRWAWIAFPGTDRWGWISGIFVSGGPNGDSDIIDIYGQPVPYFG
ncbi:hypothetical protein [Streptomyces sp. NRRL WC-3742]|uniref:hypothetical protein n=1 Tax=Streptomyces sp. NRRL WC-3742 TaxID=1463934 RepID=UPI0004CBC250|nr:hypothetical protein [Streptomyces sp. NRRL WC-3742]